MIVSGFIEPLVKELPMEYAVEMNRLIQLANGRDGGLKDDLCLCRRSCQFLRVLFLAHLGRWFFAPNPGFVFLGGTSVLGGTGTILGTFLGAFIIGAIEAATVAVGLTGFWTNFIYGLIIVLSVIMHTYLRKRGE